MTPEEQHALEIAHQAGMAIRAVSEAAEATETPGQFMSMFFSMMVWKAADMMADEEMLHTHVAYAMQMWRDKHYN